MFNVLINSSNVASVNNNIYNYQFKTGSVEIPEDSEAMITSFQIPYSWYNITTKYGNNSFKFYYPTAATTYTTFTVTIPDGFYTQTAFNAYMQQWMIDNKLYLIDGSGNFVYFFSWLANSTAYANQLILKVVPIANPAGYSTVPSGFPGFPTTARTPYIEILNNAFSTYAGFNVGTYPATPVSQITNYNALSNKTPNTTTVNSLVLRCSLVNNGTSNASDIIDAFSIGSSTISSFGSNLSWQNGIEKFVNITSGRFNSITISIVDQNLNTIDILDNNILISLLIRKKKNIR